MKTRLDMFLLVEQVRSVYDVHEAFELVSQLLFLHTVYRFQDVYAPLGLLITDADAVMLRSPGLTTDEVSRMMAEVLGDRLTFHPPRVRALMPVGETTARLSRIMERLISEMTLSGQGQADLLALGNQYSEQVERLARSSVGIGRLDWLSPPSSLARLEAQLLAVDEGMTVLDLHAGGGQHLVAVGKDLRARGLDVDQVQFRAWINNHTVSIAAANLVLNGITTFRFERHHLQALNKVPEVDRIIATPPFGAPASTVTSTMDGAPPFLFGPPRWPRTLEWIYIQIGLKALKPGGRATIITPHGALFRQGLEEAIRRDIVGAGWLASVTALPSALYPGTGIPVALIVFERPSEGAPGRDKVWMVDAGALGSREGRFQILTDENVDLLVNILRDPTGNTSDKGFDRAHYVQNLGIHFHGDVWQPATYIPQEAQTAPNLADIHAEVEVSLSKLAAAQTRMLDALKALRP